MSVFNHLLYEYQKGLRGLALHTFSSDEKPMIVQKLTQRKIHYYIQEVNNHKMNIFFGSKACVDVVKSFGEKKLSQYTSEEDFILGIMLGYDRENQCKRYLKTKKIANRFPVVVTEENPKAQKKPLPHSPKSYSNTISENRLVTTTSM